MFPETWLIAFLLLLLMFSLIFFFYHFNYNILDLDVFGFILFESLCFLDVYICFLFQIREVSLLHLQYVLCPVLSLSSPSGIPTVRILVEMLFQSSLNYSYLKFFSFDILIVVLFSLSLLHFSVFCNLILISSSVFFISIIVLFCSNEFFFTYFLSLCWRDRNSETSHTAYLFFPDFGEHLCGYILRLLCGKLLNFV